ASGALDSAIDWFWQTRQRSLCDSSIMSASSLGSAATAGATPGSLAVAMPAGVVAGPASAVAAWSGEAISTASAPVPSTRRRPESRDGTNCGSTGTTQLLDLGHDLGLERLGGDRADVLVADAALAV